MIDDFDDALALVNGPSGRGASPPGGPGGPDPFDGELSVEDEPRPEAGAGDEGGDPSGEDGTFRDAGGRRGDAADDRAGAPSEASGREGGHGARFFGDAGGLAASGRGSAPQDLDAAEAADAGHASAADRVPPGRSPAAQGPAVPGPQGRESAASGAARQ
ncbi:hypothetical protein EBN88_29970, partial [Streptomyces triticirhizae]